MAGLDGLRRRAKGREARAHDIASAFGRLRLQLTSDGFEPRFAASSCVCGGARRTPDALLESTDHPVIQLAILC
jgi:hypothetical protein